MPDYGEIRRALRTSRERFDELADLDCPDPCCPGTLHRTAAGVGCSDCERPVVREPNAR